MLSFLRGRKKNIIQIVIFCLFFLSYSVTSKAVEKIENDTVDLTDFGKNGFSFVVKRYIYLESDIKGISISLKNNNNSAYLINSSILFNDDDKNVPIVNKDRERTPLMILPPLYRLEPSSEYSWNIRRISEGSNDMALPKDRESLFWIAFRAVPLKDSKIEEKKSVSLTITPTFFFKLIYRPESIMALENKDVIDDVIVEKVNENIVINNKSPLYMTFEYLKVGEVEIKNDGRAITVKPFSTVSVEAPKNVQGKLSWRFNDENFFIIKDKEY
ncbi:fimbrial biogenesis chaperone [Proteus mirabilis]|nr:molecular chaperone [Proteus mirabilis]EKX9207180.1 molecular chaperone [Proteus mirabilis]